MATKFFNNENCDTLFAKLKGIAEGMGVNFHTFQAVSGYFRSSGYFKLRQELKNTQKIQVLVGINIDDVFRKSRREGMMFLGDKEDANDSTHKDSSTTYAPPATRRRLRRESYNFAMMLCLGNLSCAYTRATTSTRNFIFAFQRTTALTRMAGS